MPKLYMDLNFGDFLVGGFKFRYKVFSYHHLAGYLSLILEHFKFLRSDQGCPRYSWI